MYRIQKECCFAEIFSKKALPQACCRSDYDGKQWWTTWSRPEESKECPDFFGKEMDEFGETLMSKPEMETLDTMTEYCLKEAEPTSAPTEFNLYSETETNIPFCFSKRALSFRNSSVRIILIL